jgi:replicative DNA helicase
MQATSMTEYERQLINSILKDNSVYYGLGLTREHFHNPQHRAMFAAIASMLERNLEVNIATLSAETDEIPPSTIASYEPWTAANAEYYARQLKERLRRRALIATMKDALSDAENESVSTAEVIDKATSEMLRINTDAVSHLRKASEIVHPTIDHVEAVYGRGEEPEGIACGYADIDELVGGFRDGELAILAARTSLGKTALALNMAQNMARRGVAVGFFSLEMSAEKLMMRLFAAEGRIAHQKLRAGMLTPKEFADLGDVASLIHSEELWIDDTPRIPFAQFRNKSRMLVQRGAMCIYLDYLTLVKYGDVKAPRYERVGELSAEVQSLANELQVPIIALSQLNRTSEGQRPTLDSIRQSGEIEENADIIMFLHRESREDPDAELIVAKHRNGPTGIVPLYLQQSYLRFEQGVRK